MAKTIGLVDTFATADSAKWAGFGTNVTINAGRLSIVPKAAYPALASAARWDLTESSVMVALVQPPTIGKGSISCALSVDVDASNSMNITVENNVLYFREKLAGVLDSTSVTFNAATHKWWRMRESGGTLYWDTSPDGFAWTNQRSKTRAIAAPTSVVVALTAGFWSSEGTVPAVLFDDLNSPPAAPPPPGNVGWIVGAISAVGGVDGGTATGPAFFPLADWLWKPIPASPVLHTTSSTWVGYMSAGGTQHPVDLYEYGVAIVRADQVNGSTPRYDVAFDNVPAWGADPFGSDTVPVPSGTKVAPFTGGEDSHLVVADPTNGKVFGMWQARFSGGNWRAGWGGVTTLASDGVDTVGSSTATAISRLAGVVTAAEMTAAIAANTGLNHTLFVSSDITAGTFVAPAIKSDGDNAGGVATPIPQGYRIQLDPSINVDGISGITAGEKVVAKTLQTHGAIIGDKGGARLAFLCEIQPDATAGTPGAAWVAAGLEWDYFDMSHIPWSSLRVLKKWDGTA